MKIVISILAILFKFTATSGMAPNSAVKRFYRKQRFYNYIIYYNYYTCNIITDLKENDKVIVNYKGKQRNQNQHSTSPTFVSISYTKIKFNIT